MKESLMTLAGIKKCLKGFTLYKPLLQWAVHCLHFFSNTTEKKLFKCIVKENTSVCTFQPAIKMH